MNEPLDESYLQWLYRQVGPDVVDPRNHYWDIFRQMYKTEFVWLVPNDDNRAEDGIELRTKFLSEIKTKDETWLAMPCSVLEMIVGVAERMYFLIETSPKHCFWVMMENLGWDGCTDGKVHPDFDVWLNDLVWRTYHRDGRGGMFPLEDPDTDQRKVEIWYQMSAYLLERGYF